MISLELRLEKCDGAYFRQENVLFLT